MPEAALAAEGDITSTLPHVARCSAGPIVYALNAKESFLCHFYIIHLKHHHFYIIHLKHPTTTLACSGDEQRTPRLHSNCTPCLHNSCILHSQSHEWYVPLLGHL